MRAVAVNICAVLALFAVSVAPVFAASAAELTKAISTLDSAWNNKDSARYFGFIQRNMHNPNYDHTIRAQFKAIYDRRIYVSWYTGAKPGNLPDDAREEMKTNVMHGQLLRALVQAKNGRSSP